MKYFQTHQESDMAELETAYNQGPQTWNEAFPPICLRSHWDPTAVSQMILPGAAQRDLAMDPRPASMICRQYYTTSAGDASLPTSTNTFLEPVPAPLRGGPTRPDATVAQVPFPPGGAAGKGFPYTGFNTNAESDVLRIGEHLTKCAEKRYIPPGGTPAPTMGMRELPGADQNPNIRANVVTTSTHCRAEDDQDAWNRSSRLFFNPTRYDRTTMIPANLKQAESKMALRC
jgi:hypothetical protein